MYLANTVNKEALPEANYPALQNNPPNQTATYSVQCNSSRYLKLQIKFGEMENPNSLTRHT